jgi:chemotaxis protein CheY-P-specific phosphatase CheC
MLSDIQLDTLPEVADIGAGSAGTALSGAEERTARGGAA